MKLDAYAKAVLTVIAVALVAIAATPWLPRLSVSPAEAQDARYVVTFPKAWGKSICDSRLWAWLTSEATRVKVLMKMQ